MIAHKNILELLSDFNSNLSKESPVEFNHILVFWRSLDKLQEIVEIISHIAKDKNITLVGGMYK